MATDIPANAFNESSDTLDPSDKRDEFVRVIVADISKVREMAWDIRRLSSANDDACRDLRQGKINIEEMLEVHDRFTSAETELTALVESIESRLHKFNRGKAFNTRLYVAHSREGLPLRLDTACKVPLWGI